MVRVGLIGNVETIVANNVDKRLDRPHYLLGVHYDGDLGKAVLEFLDESGERLVLVPDPNNHRPYFLAKDSVEDIKNNKQIASYFGFVDAVEVVKVDPLTMNRVKLSKVITRTPTDVAKLRKYVSKAWEAKIKYYDNYIFDNGLIPGMKYVIRNEYNGSKLEIVSPPIARELVDELKKTFEGYEGEVLQKVVSLWIPLFEESPPKSRKVAIDVEVYTPFRGRVPSSRQAEYPIISISLADDRGFKKVLILGRESRWCELPAEYPLDAVIEVFDSERTLILEAIRVITKYPVVVTFNGDNFDLPYIYNRALKMGIPREYLPFHVGEDFVRVKSSVHVDLYKFFKNRSIKVYAFKNKYQEDNLDSIASALLGMSKIAYTENIGDLPIPKLAAYNFRDAELVIRLITFNGELAWKLMILLARISKTSVEDICRKSISKWIQNQLYWEHRRLNYLIPEPEDIRTQSRASATKAAIEGKKYAGALVIEPPRGVLFNVAVLDIASLYPSIMKKFNLSYETVERPSCSEGMAIDVIDETGRKIHSVCRERPGLTAEITGLLRDFRVKIYKKRSKMKDLPEEQLAWYDVVQQAIKVFINASYGVFGSENFPLYSPAVAESVTALGRKSLYQILRKGSEIGVKVIYGDTDSIFLWNPSEEHLDKLQKWVSRSLGLEIEVDKVFKFVIFTGLKKNYIGKYGEGGIEVKGLIAKKRNTPEFLKELFEELIEKIKSINTPEDFVHFKDWLESRVRNLYKSLKKKEITLDKLTFKVSLTKRLEEYVKAKPPHIKAAIQLKTYGYSVQEGDNIPYVKIRGGYKAVQLAKLQDIEPEKYIEIINSALSQLLGAFGVEWEDIIGIKKLREVSF